MSKAFELNAEKANRLDDQANYLNLKFIIGYKQQTLHKAHDRRDDFNFHIVNFPFLSSRNHLTLHMVFTFHRLSDMQDVAHVMMTLDIVIKSQ